MTVQCRGRQLQLHGAKTREQKAKEVKMWKSGQQDKQQMSGNFPDSLTICLQVKQVVENNAERTVLFKDQNERTG